jgi:hypothetical protein
MCSALVCKQCWLDREKLVAKQVPNGDLYFKFLLKFYTPDPNMLEDEFTRLVFCIEIAYPFQYYALS